MKTPSRTIILDRRPELGFTIIEVALVLAIAGLIFLVVFLALPALQKSQRDTAKKQDVARVASALQSYTADSQGGWGNFPDQVGDYYQYTEGTSTRDLNFFNYTGHLSQIRQVIVAQYSSNNMAYTGMNRNSAGNQGNALVSLGAVCKSDNTPTDIGATPKNAAIIVRLESGVLYCSNI